MERVHHAEGRATAVWSLAPLQTPCLTLVYRRFFPVLALLESQHIPTPDTTFKASRRVMFMEKMFASLLLLPVHIREAVTTSLMVPTSHAICGFVYHMTE